MRLAFELPSSTWVDIIQSVEGLNRTKMSRKEEFTLFASCLPAELGHQSSSALGLGFIPLTPMVLRPSDSDWNYTTSIPGRQACRWQIVGLLSLHDCVSQFFIVVRLHQVLLVHIKYCIYEPIGYIYDMYISYI